MIIGDSQWSAGMINHGLVITTPVNDTIEEQFVLSDDGTIHHAFGVIGTLIC